MESGAAASSASSAGHTEREREREERERERSGCLAPPAQQVIQRERERERERERDAQECADMLAHTHWQTHDCRMHERGCGHVRTCKRRTSQDDPLRVVEAATARHTQTLQLE